MLRPSAFGLVIGTLGLLGPALAQQLGSQPQPSRTTATTGTLTLTYNWRWDQTAPGNVQVSGDVPPTDGVVTGVRRAAIASSQDVLVQSVTLQRGSGWPVPLYPGYEYTDLFNTFRVLDTQWIAIAVVNAVQRSSTLTMVVNIEWKVPTGSPPPPQPQPLLLTCSASATVHVKSGQRYSNNCAVSGGKTGNGTAYWAFPNGLPPGLTFRLPPTIYGIPQGGSYSYTVKVSDSAGETRTLNFSISVDVPELKQTTDGVGVAIRSIVQD